MDTLECRLVGHKALDASFVILAMFASVEAIFLPTFVLISQNRMAAEADKRAELDLQVGLLAEHEITRLITLVTAIGKKMDIEESYVTEIEELLKMFTLKKLWTMEKIINDTDNQSQL